MLVRLQCAQPFLGTHVSVVACLLVPFQRGEWVGFSTHSILVDGCEVVGSFYVSFGRGRLIPSKGFSEIFCNTAARQIPSGHEELCISVAALGGGQKLGKLLWR